MLIRWNRSNSEDQELLRAGQLYQTWCHNQPVRMFRQEDFLDTLKHRDTELQLAVKMLTYRFPPGQISADKNAALCLLSASCRKLVTDRIYDGKIRLSTLQTLCLLSMISFSGELCYLTPLTFNNNSKTWDYRRICDASWPGPRYGELLCQWTTPWFNSRRSFRISSMHSGYLVTAELTGIHPRCCK